MKTQPVLEAKPPSKEEPAPRIDTSKMSRGKREALELTEAAREGAAQYKGFASNLFMGRLSLKTAYPFPKQSEEDKAAGAPFLSNLEDVLRHKADPDAIDAEGEIPDSLIDRLAEIGAFGIKTPREYGGLGLSQLNYSQAAMLLGSHCGNLTALLSAHQSIGVPQPLLLFGTDKQKREYLPRLAAGEISAFALTERDVGSDPAQMKTYAEPTADGDSFILNGEKLWCTNGTRAGVIVVMARTPDKVIGGKKKKQITAFIVEMDTPGVEVVQRCHFMGLKALYNGLIRFNDVRLPRENIILSEGKGLKVALTTLNTGRITLPAACVGFSKRCLKVTRKWAVERKQWGGPIGKHSAIAEKIARMAADIFALESMVLTISALVDRKDHDVRVEAAMCKLGGTEIAWRIIDDTMQIRGGRGYETADSLKTRGEDPVPVERMMRDSRINLIFEGSSEIMRLFLAREALEPHLAVAGGVLNSRLPLSKRFREAIRATIFYSGWYPQLWIPSWTYLPGELDVSLRTPLAYVSATSRQLARALFHSMARHGPRLDKEQCLLGRIVDIGTELFAITAATLRADSILKEGNSEIDRVSLLELVDFLFRESRLRIERKFHDLRHHNDRRGYRLAQDILDEQFIWLEHGII